MFSEAKGRLAEWWRTAKAFVFDAWFGKVHPGRPALLAGVLCLYTISPYLIRGGLGYLPVFLDKVLPYAMVILGIWSAWATWKCAENGPPIWPATWRTLAIVFGVVNVGVWGAWTVFTIATNALFYLSILTAA